MLLEHGADDSVLMKIIEMKNKVVVIAGFAVLAFIVWLAIAIKNNQRPERIMVDIVDTMAPESWELRKELEKKEESYRGLQKLYVDDIDIYQEENDFLKKENVRLRKDVALRERLLFNEIQNSEWKDSVFDVREAYLSGKMLELEFMYDGVVRSLALKSSDYDCLQSKYYDLRLKHLGIILTIEELLRDRPWLRKDMKITFDDRVEKVERDGFWHNLFRK